MSADPSPRREISPAELRSRIETGEPLLLLDVRNEAEWAAGHIGGSIPVPAGSLPERIGALAPDPADPVVVICSAGNRSRGAAALLAGRGYPGAVSLAGGVRRWRAEGHPIEGGSGLDEASSRRYERQWILPEVGEAGQQRLGRSRVLVVGAGGLGCPAALYLAAAGVGTLGIVDSDRVEESNLHRQVLHREDRIGLAKTESARQTLAALNASVRIVPIPVRLDRTNVAKIIAEYDLVLDGSDNFPTRYLINDACVLLGRPNIQGSVYRFEGQVSVFHPPDGPCYRCLHPEPPPAGLVPSCAEAGVLGVLPGVIGLLQATEAIKLILGVGEPLIGRLLHFDALSARFREIRFPRDVPCPHRREGTMPVDLAESGALGESTGCRTP